MSDGRLPLWLANLTDTSPDQMTAVLVGAGDAIVALRRMLRTYDPALPDAYDGLAWQPIEEPFKP